MEQKDRPLLLSTCACFIALPGKNTQNCRTTHMNNVNVEFFVCICRLHVNVSVCKGETEQNANQI